MPIRVFLVDDQTMLTDTLSLRLSEVSDLVLVGRSVIANPDLVDEVATHKPDVATIDVEPLGRGAGELINRLLTAWPIGRIVVLTGSHDTELAVHVARAGAVAWVEKEGSLENLITVIQGVRIGQSWYPPEHLGAVLRALRADAAGRGDPARLLEGLSVREFEVLLGIVDGLSYKQIARAHSISVKTVQSYAVQLFAKLGVHGRDEAAGVASHAGLLRADERDRAHASPPVRLVRSDDLQPQPPP